MAAPAWQDEITGPRWVRGLWGTRRGRILLALAFLGIGVWILGSAIADPDGFFDRGRATAAFFFAPALIIMFGLTLAEAIRDLSRGENRRPLVTRMPGVREGMPWTGLVAVVYTGAMIAAYLALSQPAG